MGRRIAAVVALALMAGPALAKGKGGRPPEPPPADPPAPAEPAEEPSTAPADEVVPGDVAPAEGAAVASPEAPAAPAAPAAEAAGESPASSSAPSSDPAGAPTSVAPASPPEPAAPAPTASPDAGDPPAADAPPPDLAAANPPPEPTPVADPVAPPPADDAVMRSREAVTTMEVRAMVPALERQTLMIDVRPPGAGEAVIANGEVPEGASPAVEPADGVPAEGPQVEAEVEAARLDLPVRKRVLPDYPPELEVVYGEQAIRCEALVEVDDAGGVGRASVSCPPGFHLAALNALQGWRWEVPDAGLPEDAVVAVSLGFVRSAKAYRPGVSVLARPEQVTGSLDVPVLVKAGKMPTYPRNVSYGDDTCVVELVVDAKGRGSDLLVDECATPYRVAALKAVKGWRWFPAVEGGERTVVVDLRFLLEQTPARLIGR